MAIKAINLSAMGRKKVAKSSKKACRTRWLSMEKAIDWVFEDFEAVPDCALYERGWRCLGNRSAQTDWKHQVLVCCLHLACSPARTCSLEQGLSKRQCFFCSYRPCYPVHCWQGVASTNKPLQDLTKDLGHGGRLSNCDLPSLTDVHEQRLTTLTQKCHSTEREQLIFLFQLLPGQLKPQSIANTYVQHVLGSVNKMKPSSILLIKWFQNGGRSIFGS